MEKRLTLLCRYCRNRPQEDWTIGTLESSEDHAEFHTRKLNFAYLIFVVFVAV